MRNISLVLTVVLFGLTQGFGQDAQFTQAYASPLTLNPALNGLFDGGYRVNVNYRDHWRSNVDSPLKTSSLSGELQFEVNEAGIKNPDIISFGLLFMSDRVNTFDLNTTQISFSFGYHKALDKDFDQYFSVGLQAGVVQKNVNYENLNFGDQFNGIDAYDLATAENLPGNNFGYGDFGLGLHYAVSPNEGSRLFMGVSYQHLLSPEVSFFNSLNFVNPGQIVENPLASKLIAHMSLSYELNPFVDFLPRIIYYNQNPHQQVLVGPVFKFKFLETEGTSIQTGLLARFAKDASSSSLVSTSVLLGVNFNKLALGLSYDFNMRNVASELTQPTIFELSLSFTGEYDNEVDYCPDF